MTLCCMGCLGEWLDGGITGCIRLNGGSNPPQALLSNVKRREDERMS